MSVPTTLHGGVASPSAPDNAFELLNEAGLTSGTYRRTTRLFENDTLLPWHVQKAQTAGLDVWLTVVGTPEDLATPGTGTTYQTWSIPPFARTMPSDVDEWARRVVERLDFIQEKVGSVPEYVEIWNEIDRVEFWDNSLADYLVLYKATATRIKAAYPHVKVGGPGLAGHFSTLEGTESALDAISRHCAQQMLPLDFLSWHHYTEANELTVTGVIPRLRALHQSLGLGTLELVVSEWNIWSNPEHQSWAFDNAEAATQMAGFLTTALMEGLDRSTFFQMYDIVRYSGEPLADLQGAHMGAITTHGIKKPSARVMSFAMDMLQDNVLIADHPSDEYAVRVLAARTPDRLRLMVSNDDVAPRWLWVQRCREYGFVSGELWDIFVQASNQAGGSPTVQSLAATGLLTTFQAQFCLDTLAECQVLLDQQGRPREVRVKLSNLTAQERAEGRIARVVRFDEVNNNYARNVEEIQTALADAEAFAEQAALEDAANYLNETYGYSVTGRELGQAGGPSAWLEENGGTGIQIWNSTMTHREAMINRRMEGHRMWDQHPATRLQALTPGAAGVEWDPVTDELVFELEPNTVIIIEATM